MIPFCRAKGVEGILDEGFGYFLFPGLLKG
jgi:hypothetical protein